MVITSRNKQKNSRAYSSTHLRFALSFVIITGFVLLFLNIYCSEFSQQLFYESKQNAVVEKAQLVVNEIQKLDALTASDIASCIEIIPDLSSEVLIVTDNNGEIIYDHHAGNNQYTPQDPFPQVTTALEGYRVFTCTYSNRMICSEAAIPIAIYSTISGCVYMMETDVELGHLLQQLQTGIFTATALLELGLLVIAIVYAYQFSRRLRKIVSSIADVEKGNYEQTITLGGNDELTFLSNEFNQLTQKLQISENKRRQFVSDASHELKTPLASIKLLSDSILQYEMDMDTVKEFVGDIGNEADRLTRTTAKLLALTRSESNRIPPEIGVVHLAPTLKRVEKMISGIARERNISIQIDIIQDSFVLIPEDDLYQIAFNLVENGIKYNVPNGKLTISVDRKDNSAILQVTDTGVGIPPDSIAHIFERFYRVDKARSRQTGGSGLGLSIVRSIVERNNGKILVESTLGEGTVFTVELPRFESYNEE